MSYYTWVKNNGSDQSAEVKFPSGTIIALSGWADLTDLERDLMLTRGFTLLPGQIGDPSSYDGPPVSPAFGGSSHVSGMETTSTPAPQVQVGTDSVLLLPATGPATGTYRKWALMVNMGTTMVWLAKSETAQVGHGIPLFGSGGFYELTPQEGYLGAFSAVSISGANYVSVADSLDVPK